MQIGDYVEIKDRKNILFKSRGFVKKVQPADRPFRDMLVLVKMLDGRQCFVEPTALKAA